MNRRNLLKTFLAAPAIIRSGVLMPVVPLVAMSHSEKFTHIDALAEFLDSMEPSPWRFQANRVWIQGPDGRRVYDTAVDYVRVDRLVAIRA